MATYGADCGTSHSYHSGVRTSSNSGEGDNGLLSAYSMLSATPLRGMASFKKRVMDCYRGFVAGSSVHHQFMAFTDVTPKRFSEIDAIRERSLPSLPRMLVLYDATEEVLIAKIMPGFQHGIVSSTFEIHLGNKFFQLGVGNIILPLGSGRYGDPNGRSKEADSAFKPVGRPVGAFPSLAVEVGVSESLRMLRCDAGFWLTKSEGQTKIVIILHVDLTTRKIVLERWECVDSGRPPCPNVVYPPTPGLIQSLELVDGQQYTGAALQIPAIKVLDGVPNNLHHDEFKFTCNELQAFSELIWAGV